MFCISSLRCFKSEGPSLRRDPAKTGGRRLQSTRSGDSPPRPEVVRAGASAPTRFGAAGVVGANRTGLGDQSVGGAVHSGEAPRSDVRNMAFLARQRPDQPGKPPGRRRPLHPRCHAATPAGVFDGTWTAVSGISDRASPPRPRLAGQEPGRESAGRAVSLSWGPAGRRPRPRDHRRVDGLPGRADRRRP